MYKRYYFCEWANAKLTKFLEANNIRYTPGNVEEGELISFSVLSNSANANDILGGLEAIGIRDPLVYAEYSAADLNKAKLLVMTPKKQRIDIINTKEAYCYSCRWTSAFGVSRVNHDKQKGLFAIRKEPSMTTQTAFWTEDTGLAERFADYRVYNLVKENFLNGIEFKKVMDKKGVYSETLYQMTSTNILGSECIGKGYGEEKEICHICGREQYCIDNAYQLHLDFSKIDLQRDLYMTERIFGPGISYPLYIISQRFYQLLKQNKLAGGVTFEAVAEIEN